MLFEVLAMPMINEEVKKFTVWQFGNVIVFCDRSNKTLLFVKKSIPRMTEKCKR